jgi:hypothetical protein
MGWQIEIVRQDRMTSRILVPTTMTSVKRFSGAQQLLHCSAGQKRQGSRLPVAAAYFGFLIGGRDCEVEWSATMGNTMVKQ